MSAMSNAGVRVERVFKAPSHLVWAIVADTNRYDRAIGMGVPRYSWREIEGQRVLVGEASQAGIQTEWIEQPYEWIEGHTLRARRSFLRGPVAKGGVDVVVEPHPKGCKASLLAYGEPKSFALRVLGPLFRAGLRRRLEAFMDAAQEVLAAGTPDSLEPPVLVVRDALRGLHHQVLSGAVSTVDQAELERRSQRLPDSLDRATLDRALKLLATGPDEEVAQIRPYELARVWRRDASTVLRVFLHATVAGLVDLNWQVNCPVCKVSAGVVRTMAEVERNIHCDACNVRYDVDFSQNVEAVFRTNRALRDVEPKVYCAASPSFRPHVLVQLPLVAGEQRKLQLQLSDGHLLVRTLGTRVSSAYEGDVAPERLEIDILANRVETKAHGRARTGVPTQVIVRSQVETDSVVLIERSGWAADAVLGSAIAAMPEFVDLFATEAPAAGLELAVQRLTFLFSDLTGSTALYEDVGDATAYAVVQQHFRAMEAAIVQHRGALVKTMGDAVMATFATPHEAAAAAKQALRAGASDHPSASAQPIGIKIGIHEGPCLAVRANDRLDYFGTTVNVCARLQGQAVSGELVMSEDLAQLPEVAALVAGAPQRHFQAALKGIVEQQMLVGFELAHEPNP